MPERKRFFLIDPFPKLKFPSDIFGCGAGLSGNDFCEFRNRNGVEWKIPFLKFGNRKGKEKHVPKIQDWEGNEKKPIPIIREQEGNEKNPFPQFGNGKGMKKTHSHNSGTGRE